MLIVNPATYSVTDIFVGGVNPPFFVQQDGSAMTPQDNGDGTASLIFSPDNFSSLSLQQPPAGFVTPDEAWGIIAHLFDDWTIEYTLGNADFIGKFGVGLCGSIQTGAETYRNVWLYVERSTNPDGNGLYTYTASLRISMRVVWTKVLGKGDVFFLANARVRMHYREGMMSMLFVIGGKVIQSKYRYIMRSYTTAGSTIPYPSKGHQSNAVSLWGIASEAPNTTVTLSSFSINVHTLDRRPDVMCIGDSLTRCRQIYPESLGWVNQWKNKISPAFRAAQGREPVFVNASSGTARTEDMQNLIGNVAFLQPKVLTLLIGDNDDPNLPDDWYENRMRPLITELLPFVEKLYVVTMTPDPNDPHVEFRELLITSLPADFPNEIGTGKLVPLDWCSVLCTGGDITNPIPEYFQPSDRVHFSTTGAAVVAEYMKNNVPLN